MERSLSRRRLLQVASPLLAAAGESPTQEAWRRAGPARHSKQGSPPPIGVAAAAADQRVGQAAAPAVRGRLLSRTREHGQVSHGRGARRPRRGPGVLRRVPPGQWASPPRILGRQSLMTGCNLAGSTRLLFSPPASATERLEPAVSGTRSAGNTEGRYATTDLVRQMTDGAVSGKRFVSLNPATVVQPPFGGPRLWPTAGWIGALAGPLGLSLVREATRWAGRRGSAVEHGPYACALTIRAAGRIRVRRGTSGHHSCHGSPAREHWWRQWMRRRLWRSASHQWMWSGPSGSYANPVWKRPAMAAKR